MLFSIRNHSDFAVQLNCRLASRVTCLPMSEATWDNFISTAEELNLSISCFISFYSEKLGCYYKHWSLGWREPVSFLGFLKPSGGNKWQTVTPDYQLKHSKPKNLRPNTYKGKIHISLGPCLTRSSSFWLQPPAASEPWASIFQKSVLRELLRKRCQSHVLMSLDLLVPKYLFMTLHVTFVIFKENTASTVGQNQFRIEQEWYISSLDGKI